MKSLLNTTKLQFLLLLVALGMPGLASADPPPIDDLSGIFCMRITDIEDNLGTTSFTFEVLNWTDTPASGLYIAMADPVLGGSDPVGGGDPQISGISIKAAGRGPIGEIPQEEGPEGIAASGVHHSGRGRNDLPGLLNDWTAGVTTTTTASWSGAGGTAIPNLDLAGAFNSGGGNNLAAAQALVPGFGFDQIGDSAIDGGPGPYFAGVPGEAGEPVPDGSGNVLDGFVIDIDNLNFGDVIALNWFLLDAAGNPLGTAAGGNIFGFGVLNLTRFGLELADDPEGGAPGSGPLDPIFVGNTGFKQSDELFVFDALDFSNFEIQGELGGSITAPFMNPDDNVFMAPVNTQVIPEPSRILLLVIGSLAFLSRRRRA